MQSERLDWCEEDFLEAKLAIRLAYITKLSMRKESISSFARNGYRLIDQQTPPLTPREVVRSV